MEYSNMLLKAKSGAVEYFRDAPRMRDIHEDELENGFLLNHKNHIGIRPYTESLKDCEIRASEYWVNTIVPHVKAGHRVLIVAHANTIRALVKTLDGIADDDIRDLRIPNGVPMIYHLDEDLEPIDLEDDIGFKATYLVSPRNHRKVSHALDSCCSVSLLPMTDDGIRAVNSEEAEKSV
jgi:broad specificity phosphatase PhoE